MVFLYVLLTVYILAVNFYGFRAVRMQRDAVDAGAPCLSDGKLFLCALLGGAIAVYIGMFVMKYRLSSFLLMVFLPLLGVFNLWCFYLGFRSIWLFL